MKKGAVPSILVAVALLALVVTAEAQQAKKVPRIAYLGGGSAELERVWLDAFLQGLRELGYFEGKYIVVERRFAAGRYDELPELAAELVRLKVDVILAASTPPRRLPARYPSSWSLPILLGPGWFRASPSPAETLRDYRIFTAT